MTGSESGSLRTIGEGPAYADGSEDSVLAVLRAASDRRTGSDELAAHISDWPSRYHLSRLRTNLLRPLDIRPGMRVLDVGAGTGVMARYAAERGASVVALEGTRSRAEAARTRCAGMESVEVVCGPLDAFEDPASFDCVLCVGVLEYAGPDHAGFLRKLRALTAPTGSLVLAIENQLGLKYLLGYGEDHLGEPWAGVEGYKGTDRVRTFSRRELSGMLTEAGFGAQRWLFPFPDYKTPTVVVDESAYCAADQESFVDQVVRWPCDAEASAPARLCDDRAAHRVFLRAGLGPDVANSFLVVAGERPLVPDGVLAWSYGDERARAWLGATVHRAGTVESPAPADGGRRAGWLRQARPSGPTVAGPTVEQLALEACEAGAEALAGVLGRWRNHLRSLETAESYAWAGEDHPFRNAHTRTFLPPGYLDVRLQAFVVDEAGRLHHTAPEWELAGPVDADLVCARALWWFAADLVRHGVRHPWPPGTHVDGLAAALALLCGLPAGLDWRPAEAELQALVTGRMAGEITDELVRLGVLTQEAPAVVRRLPFTELRRALRGAGP